MGIDNALGPIASMDQVSKVSWIHVMRHLHCRGPRYHLFQTGAVAKSLG